MQNALALKGGRKAYTIGLVVLGLVALACILLHFGANMHVASFLFWVGIPNAIATAYVIVDSVLYGGAWLASLEFPVIAPIAATITYWLLSGYAYAVAS